MPRKKTKEPANLFLDLMQLRDEQRERLKTALKVVRGEDRPLENNPMGFYRCIYTLLSETGAFNALQMWVQEIPPGSCSGKQSPGWAHALVVEGQGYTIVDGGEHGWEKWDVIYLPLKPGGVVFQHFNTGTLSGPPDTGSRAQPGGQLGG